MKIAFSPMRRDDRLQLSLLNSAIVINGIVHDFTTLAEGATIPQSETNCEWLASDVTRENGMICLTLILPHGAVAPHETLFPQQIIVSEEGPIELPPYDAPLHEGNPDPASS